MACLQSASMSMSCLLLSAQSSKVSHTLIMHDVQNAMVATHRRAIFVHSGCCFVVTWLGPHSSCSVSTSQEVSPVRAVDPRPGGAFFIMPWSAAVSRSACRTSALR